MRAQQDTHPLSRGGTDLIGATDTHPLPRGGTDFLLACKEVSIYWSSASGVRVLTLVLSRCKHGVSGTDMWNDTDTPLAYFISFRTYGTWLHGDTRGSIDRLHNAYQSPYLPKNERWRQYNEQRLKAKPLILHTKQRRSIDAAIRETCTLRKWSLQAINVRTNHIHTVVSAHRRASLVLNAFKANSTRQLRQEGLWAYPFSPWADKGSKRRLWNERSVARAIDYVVNGQGGDLPDFDD